MSIQKEGEPAKRIPPWADPEEGITRKSFREYLMPLVSEGDKSKLTLDQLDALTETKVAIPEGHADRMGVDMYIWEALRSCEPLEQQTETVIKDKDDTSGREAFLAMVRALAEE